MRDMSPAVTLLTFFTEGPPDDRGLPLVDVNRRFRDAVSPYVDHYVAYNPKMLAALGPEGAESCADLTHWLQEHPHRHELGHYNRVWARVGFSRWKALLIRDYLARDTVRMGDIVLYHDVNCVKYPQYLEGIAEWRSLCVEILDTLGCDVFAPAGLPLFWDVKASLIRRYLRDVDRYERGVWSGLLVIRKSPQSLAFVDEWQRMCADLDNSSPLPNPNPDRHVIWHSVDQSVLGVLALMWKRDGRLPADWPRYGEGNRVFDRGMLTDVIRPPSSLQLAIQHLLGALPQGVRARARRLRIAVRSRLALGAFAGSERSPFVRSGRAAPARPDDSRVAAGVQRPQTHHPDR